MIANTYAARKRSESKLAEAGYRKRIKRLIHFEKLTGGKRRACRSESETVTAARCATDRSHRSM
jgi:hypothetical protein